MNVKPGALPAATVPPTSSPQVALEQVHEACRSPGIALTGQAHCMQGSVRHRLDSLGLTPLV